jgi:UV DNA damage endonuclease
VEEVVLVLTKEMGMEIGYACINVGLTELPKKQRVMCSRGMIKKTFAAKGTSYAAELATQNCRDLLTYLQWNEERDIRFFRISSQLFPWMSEYEISELPRFGEIREALQAVGDFATKHGHRLTFHPGPYNKLASPNELIVANTVKEIAQHSEVFDLMGFAPSHYNKINIHVGGTYGNKLETAKRFCANFPKLPESARKRLTVENDDRASMYSTKDLVEMVHADTGIPIVHDFHHHTFCTGGLTQPEALRLAVGTWGEIKPVTHYSESRRDEKGDPKIVAHAHSDYVKGPIDTYGFDVDVMLEAKMKEKALLDLRSRM